MNVTCGSDFLRECGARFTNEEVRGWVWGSEDDVFGKSAQWSVGEDPGVEAIATVDLQEDQLQLTITERGIATSSEDISHADAQVVFDVLVVFVEEAVTLNGERHPYTYEALVDLIRQFNEQS